MKRLAVFVSTAAFGVAGVAIANGTGQHAAGSRTPPAAAAAAVVREGVASQDRHLASVWDGQGPGSRDGEGSAG